MFFYHIEATDLKEKAWNEKKKKKHTLETSNPKITNFQEQSSSFCK